MKNVHILPTTNYRHDYALKSGEVIEVVRLGQLIKTNIINEEFFLNKNSHWAASCDTDVLVPHHIYITSDEEIKAGDWFLDTVSNTIHKGELAIGVFNTRKKIILTTDHDLIKEDVQPIDDESLEWFVKNPNCEKVEIENGWGLNIDIETPYYKIIIQKEENIYDEYLKDELKKYKNIKAIVFNKPEEPKQETLPTKWFKTEEIDTWVGSSEHGGRGKLVVLHQCGENKEELISQLKTLINGIDSNFEWFAQ